MKTFCGLLACVLVIGLFAAGASEGARKEFTTLYPNGEVTELTSLNYLKENLTSNIMLAYCTEDGLVEFDRFGLLVPSLATSWEVSDDQVTYTFHLRKGVKWYTWDGKEVAEVVAQDFVDSMKWVLTKENSSFNSKTVYSSIKNALEFYDGQISDFGQVGVRAIDDYTLQYVLIAPVPYFIKQLSFPCFYPVNGKFLEEKGVQFGITKENVLYCGAYFLTEYEPQQQRVLTANPNYWNKSVVSVEKLNYIYNAEATALGPELFLRGEIDDFPLPGTILDEWMNDPAKKAMMYPRNPTNMSYFLALNFNPNYEEAYAPEDWKVAVDNLNFRKSLFHAFDREGAAMTLDPFNPKGRLLNTLTRRGLIQAGGVDYTQLPPLKPYSDAESFDPAKAKEYKAKAMEELKDKIAFPLQLVMPYRAGATDEINRMQIIEQQMETLLGTDYIDIVLVTHPSTGYNQEVRGKGKYAIMEAGWGPDFADPLGSMDPVLSTALADRYSSVFLASDLKDADGGNRFEKQIAEAAAEVKNLKKRYEMFAQAEKILLDNALLIPFYVSGGGYRASYVHPFSGLTGQMGRFGLTKPKGIVLLDEPVGMEKFPEAQAQYEKERQEAIGKNTLQQ
ncbi:MAG: peptide ABC transporter substrate-binding protein [Synergistaceae bacterium]|nr:peptide ABC transporter substrate-binding protein [Synergistaceae bacterium]